MNGLRALCPCCSAENKIDDAIQVRRLIARFCRSDGPLPRAISIRFFQIIVREIRLEKSFFSVFFLSIWTRFNAPMSRCVPLEPRKPSHRALQLSTKTPDRVVSSVACRNRRPAQGKRHFFRLFHSFDGLGLWSLVKEYKRLRDDIFKDKKS